MATILLVEDDTSMRLLTTAKLKHRYACLLYTSDAADD